MALYCPTCYNGSPDPGKLCSQDDLDVKRIQHGCKLIWLCMLRNTPVGYQAAQLAKKLLYQLCVLAHLLVEAALIQRTTCRHIFACLSMHLDGEQHLLEGSITKSNLQPRVRKKGMQAAQWLQGKQARK